MTKPNANELPPVEKVTDETIAALYAKIDLVNINLDKTIKASMMQKSSAAEVLMTEIRDLLFMQTSAIHNVKAEIGRLRQFGFGAE